MVGIVRIRFYLLGASRKCRSMLCIGSIFSYSLLRDSKLIPSQFVSLKFA